MGCSGNEHVKTPSLDKLASEGVYFTNCIANCPVSTPDRAVLLTGKYPLSNGTLVNDLPLSMVLSWYEQKAVCILLTLLHLGIQNIRLGPSLPAFVSPAVLNVLVEKFNIAPITTPEADLKAMLS